MGEPKDLFPAPFVGQRVALRTPSRGSEVRLFTVAKVSEADGDVVVELLRVGPSGSSTERFDVVWRVREFVSDGQYPFGLTGCVDIRSRLPAKVEAVTNAFREDDVQEFCGLSTKPPTMSMQREIDKKVIKGDRMRVINIHEIGSNTRDQQEHAEMKFDADVEEPKTDATGIPS